MTDELKAEDYLKSKDWNWEQNQVMGDEVKQAYLAGLAEGRKESTTISTHLTNCPTYQKLQQIEKENSELRKALNNNTDTASATQLIELIQVREENEKLKAREKALGERVLQLEKDKGKLIDENRKLRCCEN